ncbi:vomeronasal type 1 receptor G9, partial [Sigmodon hispidus]
HSDKVDAATFVLGTKGKSLIPAIGIFLFSQITMGLLGNSSILFYYVILILNGKRLMPKDLIIEHLALSNCLTIISRGIPQTMSDFGFKHFLGDIGCKFIVFIYRITRGMSLYAMSLLSSFQAITINQSNSRWMKLKHRATKYIGTSCSLGWLVHLLLNIVTPARVSGPISNKNVTSMMSYEYCSWFASGNLITALYMFLLCFTDGLCLGLMACSSVSMVSILYSHKRQVKHIHSAQHFLKVSPEDRAARTVLILVCIFGISYLFSSMVVIFKTYSKVLMLWRLSVFIFLEICFPVFYPIVLITNMKMILPLFYGGISLGSYTKISGLSIRMAFPSSAAIGIFLFSQLTMGLLGNLSILFYYPILIFNGKHLKPKDLIIEHLALSNCLTIISRGIPQTMSDFGFKNFLGNIGCKLIVFIYRITRGMSLYAMSLLSCFQAITINPRNSRWMKLKHRATKYIGTSCSLGWLVHLLLNIVTPARVSGPISNKNVTSMMSYEYCSWFASGNLLTALYMFLLCFTDALCLGLMACSSVSMVRILYIHKRQVKHIHSAQYFLKVSPEDRATQIILILVCIFVISYLFSSMVVIFKTYSKYLMLWRLSIFTYLEICFPIFYPIIFIRNIKNSSGLILLCCELSKV